MHLTDDEDRDKRRRESEAKVNEREGTQMMAEEEILWVINL